MSELTRPEQVPRPGLPWYSAYIGWVALYAGAWIWFLTGRPLHDVFAGALYLDFLVNMAGPWILGAALMLYAIWLGRSELRSLRMIIGALMMVGFSGLFLWGVGAILHSYGGWSFVAAGAVLLGKVNWKKLITADKGAAKAFSHLMARSMLVPFACFAPALILCCTAFDRQTLDVGGDDWVGPFGVLYFAFQGVLDYFLLRRMKRLSP